MSAVPQHFVLKGHLLRSGPWHFFQFLRPIFAEFGIALPNGRAALFPRCMQV